MGSFSGRSSAAFAAMAAQVSTKKALDLARSRYNIAYGGTLFADYCVEDERYVSEEYEQRGEKCKCCGSQEARQHKKRTICAYCRSIV